MHRVEPAVYQVVRPLFAKLAEQNLHITAILDGSAPGTVYVDDVAYPRTACIASGDAYYAAGEAGNRAFNAAFNAILPRDTYFVLFCALEHWGDALEAVLADTYAVQARRRYYVLQQLKMLDWRERIPEGFSMQRVDAALLARGLNHTDDVVEGMLQEWRSLDAFLERGFGHCLVHGEDIVSWSMADYVHDGRCEIGIHTDWTYRRQGFGTLTAAANAAYARAHGFSSVGWHCWANNAGSIGVAENVGLALQAEYDVFINHWAAENVSDMTAAEFRAFAEGYERWFEREPPSSGYPHIVAATAWSLCGDREGCFRQLHKAVDVGWLRSVERLREIWPEFFSIQHLDQAAEWQGLARRLGEGAK